MRRRGTARESSQTHSGIHRESGEACSVKPEVPRGGFPVCVDALQLVAAREARRLLRRWRVCLVVTVLVVVFILVRDVDDMTANFPMGLFVEDPSRPGLSFQRNSTRSLHPVVLFPGFITTALEVWEGDGCAMGGAMRSGFRQRMFSAQMLLTVLTNPECFLRLFSLDYATGGDPAGIRVRPDSSFSSSDYIVFGFWVWAKMIVNLADIGYDPNRMFVASYDWRLDPERLEERDKFFSRLKAQMEVTFDGLGHVLVAHSYGANVILSFLNWADAQSPGWTNRYVSSVFDIGGPIMGMPKALAALLSGEVKDTALLPTALRSLLDSHINRPRRTDAFRSWLCLPAIVPRGGDCLWPQVLHHNENETDSRNMNGSSSLAFVADLLLRSGHVASSKALRSKVDEFRREAEQPRPLMPQAPNVTFYCFYGVNIPTETAYWVTTLYSDADDGHNVVLKTSMDAEVWSNNNLVAAAHDGGRSPFVPHVRSGVGLAEGDGTVPLVSLGYACRSQAFGLARHVKRVVTVELQHEVPAIDLSLRGGPTTADHVDVMGNYEVIRSLLYVVTGQGDDVVRDKIHSQIDTLVAAIDTCRTQL